MSTTYRCLTIHQPHASLLASGLRIVETRSRPLSYRGPLMIHAGLAWSPAVALACLDANVAMEPTAPRQVKTERKWRACLGCVLAVADLHDCRAIPEPCGTAFDFNFGSFGEGRFGLFFRNLRPLRRPVKATGKQGLWIPDAELIRAVEGEL